MEVAAPLDRGFGRVVRIVLVTVAVTTALWAAAIVVWKPAIADHAESLFGHRHTFREQLAPTPTAAPRVVWLGDSTMVQHPYPDLLQAWFQTTYGAETRVAATAGMTTYNYYSLMDLALDTDPTMVVFVANLRMFALRRPNGMPVQQFGDDLASMIPAAELPHAFTLPWMARSISLPHLLLVRLLQVPWIERAVALTAGLGEALQARSPWALVASPAPAPVPDRLFRNYFSMLRTQAELYDVRITPRQPYVQMMAAAVRMATRRGVPVVVIASPIPVEGLADFGYPKESWAPRFAILREVAETEGAVFLDFHDALPQTSFSDAVGHYTADGAARFAELLKAPLGHAFTAALARRPAR